MSVLPTFDYHPDPVGTGSVQVSAEACEVCRLARGYVYAGPVDAPGDLGTICPWCIADGRAAALGATFCDASPRPAGVPPEVVVAIEQRTPGFLGWQQERWLFHCDDGAAYLGRAGTTELAAYPTALDALRADGESEELIEALHAEGDATAYLFRCRHCGTHLAYADCL